MPINVVGPLFVKQAVALALFVLNPVNNLFGYLNSEYQLPNFIRRYRVAICNVFIWQEMQKYFLFRYDQLVRNGRIKT
jgi:hypothetical protein